MDSPEYNNAWEDPDLDSDSLIDNFISWLISLVGG